MESEPPPSPSAQKATGLRLTDLIALLALDQVRGFGPGAFRTLAEAGVEPRELLDDASLFPLKGKRGDKLRKLIQDLNSEQLSLAETRAVRQMNRAAELGVRILTYKDRAYPPNLLASNNPVPVLYARGDLRILRNKDVVACVGSRKTRPKYVEQLQAFCERASKGGWMVASGFANGADTAAHRAAVDSGGATVLVMPSGLDIPFPPENRDLWKDWLDRPRVAMISEFPIGTKASALTLRKRNKTIVGVARAVLVAQSSAKGGTMNAYRFGLEQRKPLLTFQPDGGPDTSGNQLILEEISEQTSLLDEGHPRIPELDRWLKQSSSI